MLLALVVLLLYLYNAAYLGKEVGSFPLKTRVTGAVVPLSGELNNIYTHHVKLWPRAGAFAERLWNVANFTPKPEVTGRLAGFGKLLNRRELPTSPVTSQQCEAKPEYCVEM